MPEDVSGAGHAQAPIIIKKIYKGGHGHHGGAWKVAYADMVTALMALFIVLWILSQSEEVIQAVAGYFRDPMGFKDGGVPSVMETGSLSGEMSVFDQQPKGAEDTAPESLAANADTRWRERAGALYEELARTPSFDDYRDQVEVALTPEGMRISLVESIDTPLFKVGSTELRPDASEILAAIGRVLGGLRHHLAIEGHTDSRPFGGGRMTNWELSTGRAQTARRVLVASGVAADRMFEVRGMADNMLYNPLAPEDSRNRRIAITLLSDAAYASRSKAVVETILSDELAK